MLKKVFQFFVYIVDFYLFIYNILLIINTIKLFLHMNLFYLVFTQLFDPFIFV
jgi:hypothetical protein